MIKIALSLLFVISNGYASRNTVYEVYNLHYLFDNYKISGGSVSVRGAYSPEGSKDLVRSSGKSFSIPLSKFQRGQRLGKSVLKVSASENGMEYSGTAFAVGENFLLTNFHVYSPDFNQNAGCTSRFTARLDHGPRTAFYCKRKIKCNKALDYCLLEVVPSRRKDRGSRLSDFASPLILHPLKLMGQTNERLMAIGNSGGHGIQASVGKMFAPEKRDPSSRVARTLFHHATVTKGNSGGPLIDHKDRVIGIVTKQSSFGRGSRGYSVSSKAVNKGSTVYAILQDLKKSSSIRKNVLPFLNIR